MNERPFRLPYFWILLSYAVIGFCIYHNVLHGEFVSDDLLVIEKNPAIRNLTDLAFIKESFSTRFLVGFSFAVNYAIHGFDVFGYHIINVLLHILNSVLVVLFLQSLLKTPALERLKSSSQIEWTCYLAGLIYLCHPLQTQAVAYITQRTVLMGAMSYLGILVLYLKFRLDSTYKYYVFALSVLLIGIFCKELVLTVPVTLVLLELCFFRTEKESFAGILKRVFPFCCVLLVLPIFISLDSEGSTLGLKAQLLESRAFSWDYFFTEIRALTEYLRLVIFPVNQNHMHYFPVLIGFNHPQVLIAVSTVLLLFVGALVSVSKFRLMSFCVFWFFITTSIEALAVCIVNRKVMDEHWMYLPMVGISIFLALLIQRIFQNPFRYKLFSLVLIGFLCLLSYNRNFVWQTEIGFWKDSADKSPKISLVHMALGSAYERKGDDKQAFLAYTHAVDLDSENIVALNNLATLHFRHYDDAIATELYERIIAIDPEMEKAYNNLAYLYFETDQPEKSNNYYKESLKRQRPYPMAYFYMAQNYDKLNDPVKALESIDESILLYKKFSDSEGLEKAQQLQHQYRKAKDI